MSIDLGEFVVGERPAPLEYQFLASDGTALDLTGYTAKFSVAERDSVGTTFSATVTDPAGGKVTYVWAGTELPTAGTYTALFWTGNTMNRFASVPITFRVRVPVAGVPLI